MESAVEAALQRLEELQGLCRQDGAAISVLESFVAEVLARTCPEQAEHAAFFHRCQQLYFTSMPTYTAFCAHFRAVSPPPPPQLLRLVYEDNCAPARVAWLLRKLRKRWNVAVPGLRARHRLAAETLLDLLAQPVCVHARSWEDLRLLLDFQCQPRVYVGEEFLHRPRLERLFDRLLHAYAAGRGTALDQLAAAGDGVARLRELYAEIRANVVFVASPLFDASRRAGFTLNTGKAVFINVSEALFAAPTALERQAAFWAASLAHEMCHVLRMRAEGPVDLAKRTPEDFGREAGCFFELAFFEKVIEATEGDIDIVLRKLEGRGKALPRPRLPLRL